MALTIKTNNQPRELLARFELPAKAQEDFDYMSDDDAYSPRIVAYKGQFYDVNEFMRTPHDEAARLELNQLSRWDGYQSDSYFSGIVIKYVDNCERVIVGMYYS